MSLGGQEDSGISVPLGPVTRQRQKVSPPGTEGALLCSPSAQFWPRSCWRPIGPDQSHKLLLGKAVEMAGELLQSLTIAEMKRASPQFDYPLALELVQRCGHPGAPDIEHVADRLVCQRNVVPGETVFVIRIQRATRCSIVLEAFDNAV